MISDNNTKQLSIFYTAIDNTLKFGGYAKQNSHQKLLTQKHGTTKLRRNKF